MAYYMRLQNLSIEASSKDIRHFFKDYTIPKGGIHIVGGVDEEAFINFSDELDLLRALQLDNKPLLGQPVRLLLEKKDDEEHNQFKELLQIGEPTPTDSTEQLPSHQQHDYYLEDRDIEPEPVHYEPPPLFGQPVKFSFGKKEEPKSAVDTVSEEPTASQWFKRQLGISAEDSSSEREEELQTTDNKTLSASDIASLMSGYQKSDVRGSQPHGKQDGSKHESKEKRVLEVRGSSEESDREEVKRSRWVYEKDIRKVEVKKIDKGHASHKGRWDASSCSDDSDSQETKHAPVKKSRRETDEASQSKEIRKVEVKKDGSLSVIRAAYSESSSEDERERSRSRRDRYDRSRRRSRERERDRRDFSERHKSSRSRWSRERDRSRHRRRSRTRSLDHSRSRSRGRERSREDSPRRSGRRREERKKMDNIPLPHKHEKRETENKFHAAAHVVLSNLDCTSTSKAIREFFSGFEIPKDGITLRVTKDDPNDVKAGVIFPQRDEGMKAEKMVGKLNGREIEIKFLSQRLFVEELKGMKEIVEENLDPARYSKIEGPPNEQPTYVPPPVSIPQQYKRIEDLTTYVPPPVSVPQQYKRIEDLPTYVPPPVSIPEEYKGIEDKGFDSLYGIAVGGTDTSVPPPQWPTLPGHSVAVTPPGPPGMALMGPGMRPPQPVAPGYGPLFLNGPRGPPGMGPSRPMPPGYRPPGSMPLGPMPRGRMPPRPLPPGFRPPQPMPPGMGPIRPGFYRPGFGPPGPWSPYGPPRPRGQPHPPGFREPVPPQTRPLLKVINTSTPQVSVAKKPVKNNPIPASPSLGPDADAISVQILGGNQGHVRIEDLDTAIKASELWQKLTDAGTNPASVTLVQDSDGKAGFAFAAYKLTVDRLKYINSNLKDMTCTLASQKARNTELTEVSASHKISVAIDSAHDHIASKANLNVLKLTPKTEHLSQGIDHDTPGTMDDGTPNKITDGRLTDTRKHIKLNLKQQRKAKKYQEELRLMCIDANALKEDLDREKKMKEASGAKDEEDGATANKSAAVNTEKAKVKE